MRPPTRSRASRTITDLPACVKRRAAVRPAYPPPTPQTSASTRSAIDHHDTGSFTTTDLKHCRVDIRASISQVAMARAVPNGLALLPAARIARLEREVQMLCCRVSVLVGPGTCERVRASEAVVSPPSPWASGTLGVDRASGAGRGPGSPGALRSHLSVFGSLAAQRHSKGRARAAAEDWTRAHVEPVGAIETAHGRPWATVLRVPLADSVAWFKACSPVQAFEPRHTAGLFARWPDRVAEVLGHDEERAWLLLADAGTPLGVFGNAPEAWLVALPLYAELQRGEAAHAHEHLTHHVPDLRVATLPARYEHLLQHD